ncbi:MAG TPA: hypothetical protein VNI83_08810 [Vicinamibacterales bacterium]|nr:hypothetical protein [Vicinamibacterales bacterium]
MSQAGSRIGPDHPLRRLFETLVRRRFFHDVQLPDTEVAQYVARLLTDFTHVDNLYRLRDARGRRLDEVAEMLVESNPLLAARSFDREREVRKHIGDYTLFFTGLFPEAVAALPRLRPLSVDRFVDYVRAGKESYAVVAAFDVFEYRSEAPLFRRLSDRFELCVLGLNLVKRDLELLQRDVYGEWRRRLGLDL